MEFSFYKYQGTGNDFVIIDNRQNTFPKNNTKLVGQMCDRKFGIGADGLILLENHPSAHFTMVYYNADGNPSSMCGNGGRCLVHFAKHLGIIDDVATFEAIDGMHEASINENVVALKMNDVTAVDMHNTHTFLDTGSPHHVEMTADIGKIDVKKLGRTIRNDVYGMEGANVNFVERISEDTFSVRTYERGVEDETLSCGTGVTAVAIAMFEMKHTESNIVTLETPGGDLKVHFSKNGSRYTDVILEGPAMLVFKGVWK